MALRAVRSPAYPMMPYSDSSAEDARQAELLADHGEDEVGVGLGNVEDLLDRRAEAVAEQAAGADRDLALHRLEARAATRGPTGPGTRSAARAGRARRSRTAAPAIAPTPATRPSWRIGRPGGDQHRARASRRSPGRCRGPAAARSAAPPRPPTPITGPATRSQRARRSSAARAITAAMCRTSASFMISLGWNCSGPAPSQRRAPLTRTPTPGIWTSTQHHEGARAAARPCSAGRARAFRRETTCIPISPTAP